ncbi:MAG: hypothetical protein PHP57_04485 [Sideroxydans sp.]|nr:hypothetical protein [Sideroxydans sp.]
MKSFTHTYKILFILMLAFVSSGDALAQQGANKLADAPALDISIVYYDRALTSDGVLRESRYEETMWRRPGHVWVSRVLPKWTERANAAHEHKEHGDEHDHKHFNPIGLPRHVTQEGKQIKLEYLDIPNKQLINIVATEFENVNFDGSWVNAYYLVDPTVVMSMPQSNIKASDGQLSWHELERNGIFQRVLWDAKNLIPREIETGKNDGSIYRKVSIKVNPVASSKLPWPDTKGYVQKEYSDFLD